MIKICILFLALCSSIGTSAQVKNIIYIDASNTNALYALHDKATSLIKELSKEGDYVVFISNDSEPIIFDENGNLKEWLDQIFVIRPGNPLLEDDSSQLLIYLKKKDLDTDVRLHVFSTIYILQTLRQLSTNYQKLMIILGYDISDEKYHKNLSVFLSQSDASDNPFEFQLLFQQFPHEINTY
jgi:hypothetical protein